MGKKRPGKPGGRRKSKLVKNSPSVEQLPAILERVAELERQLLERQPVHQTVLRIEAGASATIIVSNEGNVSQLNTNIGGSVGNLAQGDKAQAINLGNITQVAPEQQAEYLSQLTPELDKLLAAMETQKTEPEHEIEVGAVRAAAAAAKKGEPSKIGSFLKSVGTRGLGIATSVGVPVVIAELKKHLGVP